MRVGRGGEVAPNPKPRSLLMRLSSAVGRLCGCHRLFIPAALPLSVTLGHNCTEAGVGR